MNWLNGPDLRALAIGAGLSLGVGMMPVAMANEDGLRVIELETHIGGLSQRVDNMGNALSAFMPPRAMRDGVETLERRPIIEVAQSSREAASMKVQLGQLEEQMRVLNGQVEGLQFQMTQMQTFLERLQQDYEFRFEQLEGSRSGKTEAAPQSGGAMLSGGAPQNQSLTPTSDGVFDLNAPDNPDTDFNPTGAPLVLGGPEGALGTLGGGALTLGGQPLELGGDNAEFVTDRDADAQYRAGYDAVARGDFEFAEDQFRQFIALFPNHTQAPEAANWLGEALIKRGAFDEAAEVFFTGFENYSDTERAPDLLLNLGVALQGAGEDDTACRTLLEVRKRFPNQPADFNNRLAREMSSAKC